MYNKMVESYRGDEMEKKRKVEIDDENLLNYATEDSTIHSFLNLCKKNTVVHNTYVKTNNDFGIDG